MKLDAKFREGAHFSKLTAGNCFCVALFMIYVFGLPFWSYLANQKLGYVEALCTTPAEFVKCGEGLNYTEIAESLGRRRPDIGLVGCTCGEGIFGDYACVVQQDGTISNFISDSFSISYYIATASATGGLAAVTFFPLLFIWGYGLGFNLEVEDHFLKTTCPSTNMLSSSTKLLDTSAVFWTQVAFQVLYSGFLFNTLCVNPIGHFVNVIGFLVAEIAHFLAMASLIGFETRTGKTVSITCIAAVVVLVSGAVTTAIPSLVGTFVGRYAFWFAECLGFSLILLITPAMLYLSDSFSDTSAKHTMLAN